MGDWMHERGRFCTTCGAALQEENRFCGRCGAVVTAPAKKRRRWPLIVFPIVGVALVAALVLAAVLSSGILLRRDVCELNGCPEFYEVEFGMGLDEVAGLIPGEEEIVPNGEETMLVIGEGYSTSDYSWYGLPTRNVACWFHELAGLKTVMIHFPEEIPPDQVNGLLHKIYGEATYSEEGDRLCGLYLWLCARRGGGRAGDGGGAGRAL